MKATAITAITLMLAVSIIFTAGCISSSDTTEKNVVIVKTQETTLQPVSYDDSQVQYSDVNGVTIAYREFGTENKEPLLMIIGFGGVMEDWNTTFIGILSEKYHVFLYDHRGIGKSTDVEEQFTISQLSDDAADLITALGYEKMNIYGVSMGSTVSQRLLIDHPDKVRKAVLSSAAYSSNIPETEKLHGLLKDAAENPDSPKGVQKEAVANLLYEGSYDGLSGITNDVMLITGTADDITPQSVAVDIADKIDGSWLVRFKGIPHVGSSYAPEEYGQIVTTFLEMDESPA
ncbi:alpha/beta fold hydrolase [Methanoplanus sp. FWC-SCC4]|uniref:Alpha/beta fold hydrolase n=1 Tax=Methanochimaera problematica TaxID=2609417 RepID=A0AA97FEP3_9EURY|nr:alpha/beta hydrolase [Methanoplanus sp. FWC-SCC4]WOF16908.1 alpha/beta fold hydrolase [Methanoplanus sp. FWC-SCC4]